MDIPRSWLFVPGDNARMMEKALTSGADALILDLEDAVKPESKSMARQTVAQFLGRKRSIPCFVRVNALETGQTAEDVTALAHAPDGIVLPKCEGPKDIARLTEMTGDLPVLAIATETVRAVHALLADDWSHPHLLGMAWGGEDLAADLDATANRDASGHYYSPFLFARDAMLFAAKLAGVAAVDAVYTDFLDPAGHLAEARSGAAVGFSGKLAIHPAQIPAIHQAYTPSDVQVAWAQKVIATIAASGSGIAQLDGQMLDRPHLRRATAILKRAEKGAVAKPGDTAFNASTFRA